MTPPLPHRFTARRKPAGAAGTGLAPLTTAVAPRRRRVAVRNGMGARV
jgi:hypothetical protein